MTTDADSPIAKESLTPTDLDPLVGKRYALARLLAHGGMADIYLANDTVENRCVAMKCLSAAFRGDAAYRSRLTREGEFLRRIRDENVVELLEDGFTEEGTPYLVLEHLSGETLHEYLARRGSMPVGQGLPLAVQLASALRAAHRAGVIHGDVKPHNVFLCGPLDEPHTVKLIDFGCAESIAWSANHPGDELVAGTPQYMAPEQICSDPISVRADVYAFGILLFRWFTGELPFDAASILGLVAHQIASAAPPPSWLVDDFPSGLERVIASSLRKDPDNRYANMEEVLADLRCLLRGEGETRGAPITHWPDEYRVRSERGRRALELLEQTGCAKRASPPQPRLALRPS